jgi:hypothetical protein
VGDGDGERLSPNELLGVRVESGDEDVEGDGCGVFDAEPHEVVDTVRFPVADVLLQGLGLGVFAKHLVADGETVEERVPNAVADAHPVPESVRERDADAVSEEKADIEAVLLRVSVVVAHDVAAADADALLEGENALLALTLKVGGVDAEMSADPEFAIVTEAVKVALGDAHADVDGEIFAVAENEALPESVTEDDTELVRTGESLGDADSEADCDVQGDGLVVADTRPLGDVEKDVDVD